MGRYLDPEPWTPNPSSCFTRNSAKCVLPPATPGGSFVDVGLRVVVRQARGTLIAFQPEHQHGTTRLFGAHNYLCSINFSTKVLDAKKVAEEPQVISGNSAGEGDRDDY